jgi:protein tyrosine/serine phosphatase
VKSHFDSKLRKVIVGLAIIFVLPCVTFGGYLGYLYVTGNVHAVVPGQVYRSMQLNKAKFEQVFNDYHIKSVLNLRGDNEGSDWYSNELAAENEHGVKHYDYPISARKTVSPQQINEIVDILRTAPKPILIHCRSGADRTGLISAVYLYAIQHEPATEAAQQLSLRYGHFPYLTSTTGAMDDSFNAYISPTLMRH